MSDHEKAITAIALQIKERAEIIPSFEIDIMTNEIKIGFRTLERQSEAIRNVGPLLSGFKEIDEKTNAVAADMIKESRMIANEIETVRKRWKKPFSDAGKQIDAKVKAIAAPLSDGLASCRTQMNDFAELKEKERRAAQARQDEAVLKAATKAEQRGDSGKAAEIIERGSEKTVEKEAVKTDRSTASSVTVLSAIIVEDFSQVPDEFKKLDESKVRKAFIAKKESLKIPGLKLVTRQSVRVR